MDFDTIISRKNTSSLKWDVKEGELPMWVADMDFPAPPCVREAIERRARHGIFGYTVVPDSWYEAISSWWERRHGLAFGREALQFCTGVVPAVTCTVKRLTNAGDDVVLLTPVYDIFFHSVENTGRHVLECPLSYRGGKYSIDFGALEDALSRPLSTMLILCNPHNPTGNVWTKEELARIGALCRKYGVTVLSDEIHCDLTLPGVNYTPFAAASPVCASVSVNCISASKAFNLAGLQSAAVYIPDERLRNAVVRGLNSDELAEPNCFAAEGVVAALTDGEEWLDGLRAYLAENRSLACARLKGTPLFPVEAEATYLLWIDCSNISSDTDALQARIRARTGLYLSAGSEYRGNGRLFLRLNLACPRKTLSDGLDRLIKGIE